MKLTRPLLFLFTSVAIVALSFSDSFTNSAQPPTGYTGAPGDNACSQSGCHVGNSGTNVDGIIALGGSGIAGGVTAGTQYNITVNAGNGKNKYGFSLTALDGDNNGAGTFQVVTANNSVTATANGRSYISHLNASSTNAWAVKWTAPTPVPSDLKFYLAVNRANNDGASSGDQIVLNQYNVTSSGFQLEGAVGVEPINVDDATEVTMFPNPVVGDLNLIFSNNEYQNVKAEIYSINGQLIKVLMNEDLGSGSHDRSFNVSGELQTGMYLVKMNMGSQQYFKKIMVQ